MDKILEKVCQTPGERVRSLREEKRYTRKELADLANITKQHVYNIETGRRRLTTDVAEHMAKALGVSRAFLMGETDFKTPNERAAAVFGKYEDSALLSRMLIRECIEAMGYTSETVSIEALNWETGEISTYKADSERAALDMVKALSPLEATIGESVFSRTGTPADDVLYLTPKDWRLLPIEITEFIEMRLRQLTAYHLDTDRITAKAMDELGKEG